tara:strand:+ start:8 stop:748 length:741 start_codon:yes stop_codon:yes gene_type:complete
MKIEDLYSIKGKTIIITGCTSGIGLELAKGFSKNGAYVIGISRSKPKEKLILSRFFKCDITDETNLELIVQEIRSQKIKIDALLNVAGISINITNDHNELSRFDQTFDTNLRSMFNIINKLKPYFVNGSSIINFSSIGGKLGFPNNPSYCASKGAVISLSRALANDLGTKNIRVNCIVPGYFYTKMTKLSFLNEKERKIREKRTMLGRWGNLNELLGASIFLASDASSYMTGTELTIDGGWSSKGL